MGLFNDESPTHYDAIVVGTGISGGWAAKELCEKGLKTLVLERGRNINHITDYKTANLDPWDMENGYQQPESVLAKDYPKQRRTGYTTNPVCADFFVKDSEGFIGGRPDKDEPACGHYGTTIVFGSCWRYSTCSEFRVFAEYDLPFYFTRIEIDCVQGSPGWFDGGISFLVEPTTEASESVSRGVVLRNTGAWCSRLFAGSRERVFIQHIV